MSEMVRMLDFEERDKIERLTQEALSATGQGARKEILLHKHALLAALRSLRMRKALLLDVAVAARVDQVKLREKDTLLEKNLVDKNEFTEVCERAEALLARDKLTSVGSGDSQ